MGGGTSGTGGGTQSAGADVTRSPGYGSIPANPVLYQTVPEAEPQQQNQMPSWLKKLGEAATLKNTSDVMKMVAQMTAGGQGQMGIPQGPGAPQLMRGQPSGALQAVSAKPVSRGARGGGGSGGGGMDQIMALLQILGAQR